MPSVSKEASCYKSLPEHLHTVADIAFGKSFDLLSEYIRDFRKSAPPSTAPAREAYFPFQPNEMFQATEYLLNTLPLFSAFPRVSTFVQEFQPTFRRNRALVHDFIYAQIRLGRERMAQRGDDKVELADCAIDMALLKDGTADELADAPLRDGQSINLRSHSYSCLTVFSRIQRCSNTLLRAWKHPLGPWLGA